MVQLNNFDAGKYSSISQAIEAISNLGEESKAGGEVSLIHDSLLLEMFLSGIERNTGLKAVYEDIILDIRKERPTFEAATMKFYEREVTNLVKKQAQKTTTSSNTAEINDEKAQEFYNNYCHYVNTVNSKGKKNAYKGSRQNGKANALIVCKACKVPGHSEKNCWTLKTCEVCHQKGHIGKYCPTKKLSNPKGSDFSVRKL